MDSLLQPAFERMKQEQEPEESGLTIDDLPIVPFAKIVSYLSLEDLIKARAVSRKWYRMISSFKVKSLCFSDHPVGFFYGKSQSVSGTFAQNFISSPRFESFFDKFGQSIISNLKRLHVCKFSLNVENGAAFTRVLASFGQLEELGLFILDRPSGNPDPRIVFELNLPALKSIQFEKVHGIERLTLSAPRLQKIRVSNCSDGFGLDLVLGESVETLLVTSMATTDATKLKSLKYLYTNDSTIDSTLLSGLEQLKEIYLADRRSVSELFKQRQRYCRTDLKIFCFGVLQNGPDDPTMRPYPDHLGETFGYLAANPLRLADEIPLRKSLHYAAIERVAPELAINIVSRFTDLDNFVVSEPVQDIQLFLSLLKNIRILSLDSDQPQELFDRLPEHCPVQMLEFGGPTNRVDLRFLLRLKSLITLNLFQPISAKLLQNVLEKLEFLSLFNFTYRNKIVVVVIEHPKRYKVWIHTVTKDGPMIVSNVKAVIQLITGKNTTGG